MDSSFRNIPPAAAERHGDHLLRALWEMESRGLAATTEALAGAVGRDRASVAELAATLRQRGLVEFTDAGWILTAAGRPEALHQVRAHRLYETYLQRETGLPPEQWHREAESRDHRLSAAEVDALAERLGHPRFDPNGDPIPTREGTSAPQRPSFTLLQCREPGSGQLLHLEDEPAKVFASLNALGLAPGQRCAWTPQDGGWLLEVEGRRLRLDAAQAAALLFAPVEEAHDAGLGVGVRRLAELQDGEAAVVLRLSTQCRGPLRERLLDLGFVPGSPVSRAWSSPLGEPVAYRIRGSMVGLRQTQAEAVLIQESNAKSEV